MLRGHATAKVDAKGRLKIPSDFLEEFSHLCGDGRKLYLTSHDGRSILAYPLPVWKEQELLLSDKSAFDPVVQSYLKATSFWGRTTALDKQGRLLVHPLLRDSAGLDGTVSVFGKQRLLELCDFEALAKQPPIVTQEDLQALASRYGV